MPALSEGQVATDSVYNGMAQHGVGVEPPFWPDFWDRGRATTPCIVSGGGGRIVFFCFANLLRRPDTELPFYIYWLDRYAAGYCHFRQCFSHFKQRFSQIC